MYSYGLIVYHQNTYHLSQRRDTLSYIHFLRGKVPSDKITRYFALMSEVEKERLQRCNFEDLWMDLYCQTQVSDSKEYQEAAIVFQNYTRSGAIKRAVQDTKYMSILPDWGFPKGRKKRKTEPDLVCAMREYREETKSRCYIEFLDCPPLSVTQQYGKLAHTTYYFIARSKFQWPTKYFYLDIPTIVRKNVSPETSDLGWFDYEEALQKIHPRLIDVLKKAEVIIKSNQYIFASLKYLVNESSRRTRVSGGETYSNRSDPKLEHPGDTKTPTDSGAGCHDSSGCDDPEFAHFYGILQLVQISLEFEKCSPARKNAAELSWSFNEVSDEFTRVWRFVRDISGDSDKSTDAEISY